MKKLPKLNLKTIPKAKIHNLNDELDPKFGYETAGASTRIIRNVIAGSVFTITEDGTADSITVYLSWGGQEGTHTVKCAIYKHSDLSLVGVTEERSLTTRTAAWFTFNFSVPKPSLSANIAYILVAWSNKNPNIGTDCYIKYDDGEANQGHYDLETYNSFPDTLAPTHDTNKYSIYCAYTAGAVGTASRHLLMGVGH